MTIGVAKQVGSDWRVAHEALVGIAQRRAGIDYEEGQALRAALKSRAHERLGYGSFAEYIERLFGYSARLTHDKLRVAEALESLPASAQALRSGAASWSCLRELTRVATPATEQAWLGAAQGRTVREVEQLVSGHRLGQLPDDPREPGAERHVLRFEVSGEVLATFREAMAKVRRDAAGPLDDDGLLLLLARQILAGPSNDGRASYQITLALCPDCERATQSACGDAVTVSSDIAAMARCDGQEVRAPSGSAQRAREESDAGRNPSLAPQAQQEDGPQLHVSHHRDAHVDSDRDAHVDSDRDAHVDSDRDVHVARDRDAHVGRDRDAHGRESTEPPRSASSGRATQTIAPATRREVLRRDQHRCRAPGCRQATFVDVHHLIAREDGGTHEAENLVTLCSAHHRACHRGELTIEGQTASALTFRHADGTLYGGVVSTVTAAAQSGAFQALRRLGFGERETRAALAQVRTHVGASEAVEVVLRMALQILTAGALDLAS